MPDKPANATEKRVKEPFTVMIKPVGWRCNLACAYCYYSKGGAARDGSPVVMSDKTLESFIRQYMESNPGPEVSFVWHGGEPTLAGLDFYRRGVDLQRRYLPDGFSYRNNLQTNGVLLDDEWCDFLATEDFDIGLSVDGTGLIHDLHRRDLSGQGSFERVMKTAETLRIHGIRPDLLCTVTSDSAKQPLAVYSALKGMGFGWIQFIPVVARSVTGEPAPYSVDAEGYGDFLVAVFDEWSRYDLGITDVQLFAETIRVWSGGEAALCWMTPECGRALVAEANGGIYSCDHYADDAHLIGNIADEHLGLLIDSPEQRGFGENKNETLPAQCHRCKWFPVCGGGCPKDRFTLSEDGEPGLNALCGGLKRFFSYARPAASIIERLIKEKKKPEVIMSAIKEHRSNIWKSIGRNDLCPCGSGRKAKKCCWNRR